MLYEGTSSTRVAVSIDFYYFSVQTMVVAAINTLNTTNKPRICGHVMIMRLLSFAVFSWSLQLWLTVLPNSTFPLCNYRSHSGHMLLAPHKFSSTKGGSKQSCG